MKRYCYAETFYNHSYEEYVIVFKICTEDDPIWRGYSDNASIIFDAVSRQCEIRYYPSYVYEPEEVHNDQIANELKRIGKV